LFIDVILPVPLDGLFTYSVPTALEGKIQPFVRVKVPFGITKTHTALVVRFSSTQPSDNSKVKIKDIIEVIDEDPVLLPEQYRLWEWISSYYMSPLGDILKAALPNGIRKEENYRPRTETHITLAEHYRDNTTIKDAESLLMRSPKQQEVFKVYMELSGWKELLNGTTPTDTSSIQEITREELMNVTHCNSSVIRNLVVRGILSLYDTEVGRLNNGGISHLEDINPLSTAQQVAFDKIAEYRKDNVSKPILLHGVTSSGKTEIYIHLIKEAIKRGEQVLYLLPEIALTVQITNRLQKIFGDHLGIYHSKYSDAERVEIWQKQLSDSPYDVILGARSSVFLPFKKLGLIIIDEEHETSFKQQDPSPRYHARSVAMMMATWAKAQVILGTATPSAESYYNATQGKYHLIKLTERYKAIRLPHIQVVDVKDLRHRKMMRGFLSPQLKEAISHTLHDGEQAIIFQNRRGFSPIVQCHQCGWSPKCPNCDVSLTYHKNTSSLVCHYCGYSYHMPNECPDCKNPELKDVGAGTEKIEDIIADEFPSARIARMDLDTTHTRNAYERIISDFSAGKTNLLIGTQMVTKGLDFDNVRVVGILNADTMLNQPDFRAYEHSFSMMTQVAGRAGRKNKQGQVILQTSLPQLPVIKHIVNNDFDAFFSSLMKEREAFHYPPFTRLIYILLKHKDENIVNSAAIEYASRLRQVFKDRVLGPDKPSIGRVKMLHIRKIVLKLEPSLSIQKTRQCIHEITNALLSDPYKKSVLISFDVDPL